MAKIKPICETIRFSTLWLLNIQLPKRKRIRKAENLFAFTWDQDKKRKAQSPAEMAGVMRSMASGKKGASASAPPRRRRKGRIA